jgi:hypothetical protein
MRKGFIALLLSLPLDLSASAQTAQLFNNGGGNGCPELSTGCTPLPINGPITVPPPAPDGSTYGGQQPVVGANVYLFQANTTGYGQPSVSIMQSTAETYLDTSGGPTDGDYYVVTDPNGFFYLTGNYACTPGSQVYAYALGGNPGAGINSAMGEMAILGTCPAAGTFYGTISYVYISEVTTVATAYALAGFATDAVHVSSSGTALALTDIQNAFANFFNLVDLTTGTALSTTPSGSGTVPTLTLNSLADILASCVNSSGPTSPTCSILLATATSNGTAGGTQPTDTATAAIYMAHNPGANVATLFGLIPPAPPYASLVTPPNDFTVPITFGGGGGCSGCTNGPEPSNGIAVDGLGNVWITNYNQGFVTELSSTGSTIGYGVPTGIGLSVPEGISIDSSGNAWVTTTINFPTNPLVNEVQVLSSTGSSLSTVGSVTTGGLDGPVSVAFDVAGNAWISNNSGSSVSEFTSMLSPGFVNGDTQSVLSGAYGIATDSADSIWVSASDNVVKLNSSGVPLFSTNVTSTPGGLYAIAIDSAGNAWIPNAKTNSVMKVSTSGAIVSPSGGYTGGGLNAPASIAVDGAGNVWVANPGRIGSGNITELSGAGTPITGSSGYEPGYGAGPMAIDGSGDVWVAGTGSVTEIIGAATPVVTPLATAVANSKLGIRP